MIKHDAKDGFKWRKYGQKNIKSASFPRSYYRCTKPDCPARKQVENGLAKYENAHNHEKPSLLLLSQQQQHKQINKQQKDILGSGLNKVEKKKSKGKNQPILARMAVVLSLIFCLRFVEKYLTAFCFLCDVENFFFFSLYK